MEVEDAVTGEKYTGQWSREKYHGHGLLSRSDGSWFEGEFKAGNLEYTKYIKHIKDIRYKFWKFDVEVLVFF